MELSLKAEQKQILSQKMIQSAEILQMTAAQLEEYLNEQELENPVLELTEKEPEKFDRGELEKYQWICAHDEQNRYLYQKVEAPEDDLPEWNMDLSEPENLRDHLWSQLVTGSYEPKQEAALQYMLESLDARGYFTDSLEEAAERCHVSLKEAGELLGMIQELEPYGVGARNLEECLCLQLRRQGRLTPELEDFICHHLEKMAKNQLPAIAKAMGISLNTVKQYCAIVKTLDPKPVARFSDVRQLSYIIPDVVIVKFKGHFDVLLNESLYPDISLNQEYVSMCAKQEDPEVKKYLLDKIHQAEWIKQCIAQRNVTLFSVVKEILSCQEEFFLYGKNYLKPLRMRDVAESLEIHESTVSRAVRQKYLQCTWGIFPLSHFFAKAACTDESAPQVQTEATASDVKRALAELVAAEDHKKPYSDRVLAEQLGSQGFVISRRTVAKYREQLGIPGAAGRREY